MKYILLAILAILISSCQPNIYKHSARAYKKKTKTLGKSLSKIKGLELEGIETNELPSRNFNLRKPTLVVIHHTAQDSCKQTYRTFALKRTGVSSHYVICEDGTVTQMLNENLRGWHAGGGSWGKINDINSVSLGIELDNNGKELFAEAQIISLIALLKSINERYNIPPENVIAHSDLAPGRKTDPSIFFPWERLADEKVSIWYNEDQLSNVHLDDSFDPAFALGVIGYNTTNLEASIQSFQLRFNPENYQNPLSEKDKKIMYLLMHNNRI